MVFNPTQSNRSNNSCMMIFLERFPPSCAIPGPNEGKITTCSELHQAFLTQGGGDAYKRAICNYPWNYQRTCSRATPGLIRDTCVEMCKKNSGKRNLCK